MLVALLLFLVLTSEPTTAPATIESLVADLSSTSWQTRQAAEDSLAARGPAVVARLQRVIKESDNEEARQRAQAALDRIADQQQVGPSLITLHVSDASARDVFADVAKQAGVVLAPMPTELFDVHPLPKITLDVDAVPFWTVM